jgi:hypothetical protein
MAEYDITKYAGRVFYINLPERFTELKSDHPDADRSLPARNLAVIVYPLGVPDAPPFIPTVRNSEGKPVRPCTVHKEWPSWWGWLPSCAPGMEKPWDGVTWGAAPNPIPKNFTPFHPVLFGRALPLAKNELFPIIKKVRALFGRDFYGLLLLHDVTQAPGKIIYGGSEPYRLYGDFPGFEDHPVIDL